jgi:hypothetical protein
MKTGRKADKSPESRVAKIEGKKLRYLTAGQGPAFNPSARLYADLANVAPSG